MAFACTKLLLPSGPCSARYSSEVAEKYAEYDMPRGWMLVNDGYGCGYTTRDMLIETQKDRASALGTPQRSGFSSHYINCLWSPGLNMKVMTAYWFAWLKAVHLLAGNHSSGWFESSLVLGHILILDGLPLNT